MATMLALQIKHAFGECPLQVYTFAAPTAGGQEFADLFDATFGPKDAPHMAWRITNVWDVVPHAWHSLQATGGPFTDFDAWYPDPGPERDYDIETAQAIVVRLPWGNVYVQPKTNVTVLGNPGWEKALIAPTPVGDDQDESWINQMYLQHSMVTSYLPLLGAPTGSLTHTPLKSAALTSTDAAPRS